MIGSEKTSLSCQSLTLRKSMDKFHRRSCCAQSAIIDIIHNYLVVHSQQLLTSYTTIMTDIRYKFSKSLRFAFSVSTYTCTRTAISTQK